MEFFRHIHNTLIESTHPTLKRELANKIDWDERLICIKGFRGVGKTTFLLDHIKEKFSDDKSSLYINLNNFYFTERTLISFADEFVKRGGKVLFLDQIQKYADWSSELRECYDYLPELKIVFTSSPLLNVDEENPDLNGIVKSYYLEGLSFREYLNYSSDSEFTIYPLEEILMNHVGIANKIVSRVRPLAYFNDYMKNGFFPYFIDNPNFYDNTLLKHINLALEIDVPYLNQIELKYLAKLRKLLHIIASDTPFSPNISKLAASVETSRATVMNYLRYLKNAKLIQLLYSNGDEDELKKPDKIYMHDTNLLYAIAPDNANTSNLQKTFFYNQISFNHPVRSSDEGDFLINDQYHFIVNGQKTDIERGLYTAADMIEIGNDKEIPLWLFGFLY
ncbi:MAG: AAA family ATPase [Prolixibacteraceae bacterium]|nr:AAA family ATPase [Prolixibacteraceae bacterium]